MLQIAPCEQAYQSDSWESPKLRRHQSQFTSVQHFAGPYQ